MRGHCGSIVAVCILYELKYKLVKLYNYFVVSFHLNRKLLNILQYKANSLLKVEAVASAGFSKTETTVMLQRALLKKTAYSECCQHWFYVIKSRVCFEKRNCRNDLVQLETCDSVFLKHVQFRTFFFSHGPPNSAWICKINVGYLCWSPSVTNSVGSSVVHVIFSRVL